MAVILAVDFLLGGMSVKVLLGALIGGAMSVAHFLVLSISVCNAIDRAKDEEEAATCPGIHPGLGQYAPAGTGSHSDRAVQDGRL